MKKAEVSQTNNQDEKPTEAELKSLQGEVDRLLSEAQAREALLEKYESKLSGNLIVCPNPLADFQMFGLKFVDGCCWIPDVEKVDYFEVKEKMPSDADLWRDTLDMYADNKYADLPREEKVKYFEKLKEELQKSRAITSSVRAVTFLTRDYGYKALRFERGDHDKLQDYLKERHAERVRIETSNKHQREMQARAELGTTYWG